MNEAMYEALLAEHGIKATANRIVVVRELAATGHPVTLAELEMRIKTIDKSGIFRALTLFRDHRLVHVIEGGGEGVHYELCHSHGHGGDDEDQHPHFYCEHCQQTFCLDYTHVPDISLPKGFSKTSANLMVRGICPRCNSKVHGK
jgi:Fur family ferric uptake transcriptional regulator